MENSLVVFSGTVSTLQVTNDVQDFLLDKNARVLGKVSSLGLVAVDMIGAAVSSVQASNDTQQEIQYFYCLVDGKEVTGCFSVIFFSDGDEVDIVAEKRGDNIFYAYAVRRPIDHRLWLHPYCSKGRSAQRFFAGKIAASISVIGFILMTTAAFFKLEGDSFYFAFIGDVFISLFFFFSIYFLTMKMYKNYSLIAEEIFSSLGYKEPRLVNMDHEYTSYLEDTSRNGNCYYIVDSKENCQVFVAPWVYRYRHAPEVPEEFKLKE